MAKSYASPLYLSGVPRPLRGVMNNLARAWIPFRTRWASVMNNIAAEDPLHSRPLGGVMNKLGRTF